MQHSSGLRRQQRKRAPGADTTVSFAEPTRSFGPTTDPFSSTLPQEGQEHTGHVAQFRHALDRISIYPPVPGRGERKATGQPEREQTEAEVAGDGTRTETVLTQAIVNEGLKNQDSGTKPMQMMQDSGKGTDEQIGELIAEAMDRVGKEGVISVEEARGLECGLHCVDGIEFDKGYISPYSGTNTEKLVQENQTESGREPIAQEGEPLQKVADPSPVQENQTGMPDDLKAGVETLSGLSLNDVRVHYNSARPAQVQALAYTQGNEIHVGPGQEQHLPHEAWHVVQQMQGRVRPTLQAKGVAINDDQGLEKEADIMGSEAEHVGNADERIEQADRGKPSPYEGKSRASGSPMQLKALVGVSSYLDSGGSWDTSTDGKGRVTKMEATGLKLAPGSTTVAPKDTNAPSSSASPPGWAKIQGKRLTKKPPYYKRMHLLNGRLGGSGTNENLTPGSGSLNSCHSVDCETPIMDEIEAGKTIDKYKVTVEYNSPSSKVPSADTDDWESCAFNIKGEFGVVDPTTGTRRLRNFEAEEDPNLDGYW